MDCWWWICKVKKCEERWKEGMEWQVVVWRPLTDWHPMATLLENSCGAVACFQVWSSKSTSLCQRTSPKPFKPRSEPGGTSQRLRLMRTFSNFLTSHSRHHRQSMWVFVSFHSASGVRFRPGMFRLARKLAHVMFFSCLTSELSPSPFEKGSQSGIQFVTW